MYYLSFIFFFSLCFVNCFYCRVLYFFSLLTLPSLLVVYEPAGHHYSARPFSGTVTAGESFFFSLYIALFLSLALLFLTSHLIDFFACRLLATFSLAIFFLYSTKKKMYMNEFTDRRCSLSFSFSFFYFVI
jgi:hypothetical protein